MRCKYCGREYTAQPALRVVMELFPWVAMLVIFAVFCQFTTWEYYVFGGLAVGLLSTAVIQYFCPLVPAESLKEEAETDWGEKVKIGEFVQKGLGEDVFLITVLENRMKTQQTIHAVYRESAFDDPLPAGKEFSETKPLFQGQYSVEGYHIYIYFGRQYAYTDGKRLVFVTGDLHDPELFLTYKRQGQI